MDDDIRHKLSCYRMYWWKHCSRLGTFGSPMHVFCTSFHLIRAWIWYFLILKLDHLPHSGRKCGLHLACLRVDDKAPEWIHSTYRTIDAMQTRTQNQNANKTNKNTHSNINVLMNIEIYAPHVEMVGRVRPVGRSIVWGAHDETVKHRFKIFIIKY